MSSNGTIAQQTNTLSPLLKHLLKNRMVAPDVAQRANKLPTSDLQHWYLQRFREEKVRLLDQLDAEMLNPIPARASVSASAAPVLEKQALGVRRPAPLQVLLALIVYSFIGYKAMTIVSLIYRGVAGWNVPVPQVSQAYYSGDHKMVLHWNPVGPGYTYRIYRTTPHWWQKDKISLSGEAPLNSTGALVDADPAGARQTQLTVAAVTPDDRESWDSAPVDMDLDARNRQDAVEPVP